MICGDIAFLIVHVASAYVGSDNTLLAVDADRSYAESFQYLKELWIGLALASLARRERDFLFAGWALLFGYLLLDDAFSIHERGGSIIATRFGFDALLGLRPRDLGELVVSAAAAGVFLLAIGWFHLRAKAGASSVSLALAGLLALLVLFGVVVDMIHQIVSTLGVWGLEIVEDGGEMLVMSVIAAYVAGISRAELHAKPGLTGSSAKPRLDLP